MFLNKQSNKPATTITEYMGCKWNFPLMNTIHKLYTLLEAQIQP